MGSKGKDSARKPCKIKEIKLDRIVSKIPSWLVLRLEKNFFKDFLKPFNQFQFCFNRKQEENYSDNFHPNHSFTTIATIKISRLPKKDHQSFEPRYFQPLSPCALSNYDKLRERTLTHWFKCCRKNDTTFKLINLSHIKSSESDSCTG